MTLPESLRRLNLHLAPETLPLLERLIDELLRWNHRRNLTAIIAREEVQEKHLIDSLTLLPFARQSTHLLDIGSGAGFPALPLKIACPELYVVSVEAVGKKVDFQRHVARTLGLQGFAVLHQRVEMLTDYRAAFDLVTARALCSLGGLIALAGPFLAPGGRLVAMKGPEGHLEFLAQQDLLRQQGWNATLHNLKLPVSRAERCLIELTR